jgi:hypothetical protein
MTAGALPSSPGECSTSGDAAVADNSIVLGARTVRLGAPSRSPLHAAQTTTRKKKKDHCIHPSFCNAHQSQPGASPPGPPRMK